ncbi:pilus assembly protein [Hydrogenophaga sp.]|uniref:pilus assembly protein n=1 Tax=Hydrogenophaga sp. TaxID=1904254 RepID=UPI002731B5D0|nr:PilC/PilY family type IV pilus protein [Hydrogenophaga sp.]MDP2016251.1 PilC/PilY family type IV pilus protein [Hydrogenophaga sp.]
MPSFTFTRRAAALTVAGFSQTVVAAPLLLSQAPPTLPREPAPNIIISADNSTTMGGEGVAALRTALKATFSATNVPDNQIRLAWQSMHGCNTIPGSSASTDGICRGFNGMRRLAGAHRTNFFNWLDSIPVVQGTPTHFVMDNAGQYLSATGLGVNSPWASNPGVTEEPVLSCRRSYHILMTDGEYGHAWTGAKLDTSGPPGTRVVRGGNADGTQTVLPDGTVYSVDAGNTQTRLYRDIWGHTTHSSLSDIAFYYWSRDLQPGIPNNLKPTPTEQFPRQNFGTASLPAELDPYWNPRNNPATWQHMVNYTIGFKDAAQWSTGTEYLRWMGDTFSGLGPLIRAEKVWASPFCTQAMNGDSGNTPCDGDYNYALRDHARKVDMWHTALNSRGRFIPAPDAQSLVDAFKGILEGLTSENGQARVSIAANSTQLRTNGRIYLASYNMDRFSGDVEAYGISAATRTVDTLPAWTASSKLDAAGLNWASRRILSHSGAAGINFNWTSLSSEQQTALRGSDTATVGGQRVDYLRGDRSREAPAGSFRQRASRMGTVVNSNLWTVAAPRRLKFEHAGHASFRSTHINRPDTVYIGANGGMLHAFDGATGAEHFAYVPRAAYAGLRDYTLPQYTHRHFVDGHPFTGDVDTSWVANASTPPTPNWRTVLVSGLGGGGRGFFVVDVTDPTNVTNTSVWLDRTFPGNSTGAFDGHQDVGHMYGAPVTDTLSGGRSEQIVKLNNKRWAVVLGNGVNSFNERPVLLIQYLDGDRSLLRIVANSTSSASNGLAPPRLVDLNANGTIDIAYAGDLQGQLWKFDLSSKNDTDWGVSGWDGAAVTCKNSTACKPLFVARDAASKVQPITTAPLIMRHPMGGIQVMFGTGLNIQPSDPANAAVQTIYSVWDKNKFDPPTDDLDKLAGLLKLTHVHPIENGRAVLVQQSITTAVTRTESDGDVIGTVYSNSTDHDVAYSRTDNTAKRGWFMDLPLSGERVLNPPSTLQGRRVIIRSMAPSPTAGGESCTPQISPGQARRTVLNMITGRPSSSPVFSSSDPTVDLSNATSMLASSDEGVAIDESESGVDLFSIGDGRPDSDPSSSHPPPSCTGNGCSEPPSTCSGSGCIERDGILLGTSRGARADWREVR